MTRHPSPIPRLLCLTLAAVVLTASAPARAYTVTTASHDVTVDCGASGTDVPTDWYFPQPNPNLGLVWLQHGFSRANNQMVDLATEIASRGYVVFATSLAPGTTGCAMNDAGFLSDFARLFPDLDDPDTGLLLAARASLPGGSYAGRGTRGWLRTTTRWKYLDRTGAPIAGITGFDVTDRGAAAAGQVKIKVTGKAGTYPLAIGDAPLAATVILGGAAASGDGRCGESAFRPGDCIVNASTTTMRCTR